MRVDLGKQSSLVLEGVGEHTLRGCKGAVDGGLIGPAEGDLGDWHAVVTKRTAANTSADATTTASGSGSGGQSNSGDSSGDVSAGACGGGTCAAGQVWYLNTCCNPLTTCPPGTRSTATPDFCGGVLPCSNPTVCQPGWVCYQTLCCIPKTTCG